MVFLVISGSRSEQETNNNDKDNRIRLIMSPFCGLFIISYTGDPPALPTLNNLDSI